MVASVSGFSCILQIAGLLILHVDKGIWILKLWLLYLQLTTDLCNVWLDFHLGPYKASGSMPAAHAEASSRLRALKEAIRDVKYNKLYKVCISL